MKKNNTQVEIQLPFKFYNVYYNDLISEIRHYDGVIMKLDKLKNGICIEVDFRQDEKVDLFESTFKTKFKEL